MKSDQKHVLPGPGHKLLICLALASFALVSPKLRADTINMSVNYYTISNTDPDVNRSIDGGVVNNEVKATLGPNGLPLFNYGGTNSVSDINGSGELTYWSPSFNSHVSYTGSGTVSVPLNKTNLFPPNGGGANDLNGLQTAVFSSTLLVPSMESISFTVSADDLAFVYLDGSIVCDLGGIHAAAPTTCTSTTMSAGTHNLQIFYADLHTVAAELDFTVNTAGISSVTPEPPSVLLLGSALLAMGGIMLRRRSFDLG